MARQQRKWSLPEDQRLRFEVEAQMVEGEVKDWCKIATKLPGRTNKDCRKRWYNSVLGGLKKGQWSRSEDVQLEKAVQRYGQRWAMVANSIGSRSADQCAKRWQQSLDPDLDHSEWRESEDEVLIDVVHRMGRHWKDIQTLHFPGRSKNCIKNRYTVLVRRYQNKGIILPQPASTPEPSTAGYSPSEDYTSYSPNVYDDVLSKDTGVSTPESIHSWPIETEPFSSYAPHDPSAPHYPPFQHQPLPVMDPANPQWTWITSPVQSSLTLPNPYPPHYQSPDAIAMYNDYDPALLVDSNHAIPNLPIPTILPNSRPPTTPHYQGVHSISHYMPYEVQSGHPYQY